MTPCNYGDEMKRLLLALILLLTITGISSAQTLVSGTVTDTGGQTWNNGTYSFTSSALGQTPITGTLSGTGTYTSVSIPHTAATALVGDVWTVGVCPAFPYGCFNSNPIVISGSTQTLNLTPGVIKFTVPTVPQAVAPITAYADAEITGGWVGFSYYNITSSSNRVCSTVSAGTCTVWAAVGGGGGALPGGGSVGQTIVNTAPGAGTWQSYSYANLSSFPTACAANQVATQIGATPGCVTLTASFLPATIVYTGQVNTYGAFLQDFTSATFKVPNGAGLAPTTNGLLAYDTTANRFNAGLNAANVIFPWFTSGIPVNAQCVTWSGTSGAQGSVSCASGFPNPMTTLGDIIIENATPTAARLAGPTTPNGVPQYLIDTPSAGLATAETWGLAGVPTNAQTGTTYTYLVTDRASYTTFSNAGAIAVTLPSAASAGFGSNFVNVSCDIGAGTATITPTTSTISYSTGSAYTAAAATLPLTTGQCAWIYSDNTNYFAIVRSGGGGSSALSAITAAIASNTIANGNNPQTWNWAQTTDAQDAFTFGETSAATGGTLTNALANQALLHVSTASGSTAAPLEVDQLGITAATGPPAVQIETTWNNASLPGEGLLFNVTNTNSAAASYLWDFRVGNTSQGRLDKAGNLMALTSLQTTTTAPAPTSGTAGFWACGEGTAPSFLANVDVFWCDSVAHWPRMESNNGPALDVAATGVNNIAFSTTPALDLTKGPTQQFSCTTAASAISPTVTGLRAGRHLTLVFIQNGTTACTLTLPATFHGQGTLGTTLSGINVQEFVVSNNGTDLYAIAAMVTNMTGGTP